MSGLNLMATVGLDGAGFERGLHRIGHTATHNLKALVAGAFGVYSVHQVLERTIESAEELITTSKRLDITVEKLQVLRQAAKENGVEFSRLATAFDKLNVAREKALAGGDEGAKVMAAFGRLGVTEKMLREQSAAEIFMGPMRHAAITTSIQDLDAPLKTIFEKGFGQLIPILKTDFDELSEKMNHLGSIMSTETAVSVKHLKDEFDLLANIIVANVAPALVKLAEWLIVVVGKIQSTGSFLGALTNHLGIGDLLNLTRRGFEGDQARANLRKTFSGSNIFEAVIAFLKSDDKFSDRIDEMKKRLAEETERLKNPGAPERAGELESITKAKKGRTPQDTNDALVRVGNFLGTSGSAISHLDRQLRVQMDMREYLRKLLERASRSPEFSDDKFYPIA